MAKILIADDSSTEVMMFAKALEAAGYETIKAYDGEAAERMAIEEMPDLLVLDIIMPKKNGFHVCRNLKTNPKTRNIPIVIVTAKGEDADVYWGKKQGADEYLIKPFDVSKLVAAVDRLLKGGPGPAGK